MNTICKAIITILLTTSFSLSISQNEQTTINLYLDSIENSKHDTLKTFYLYELGELYINQSDFINAEKTIQTLDSLSTLLNLEVNQLQASILKSKVLLFTNKNSEALALLLDLEKVTKKVKDEKVKRDILSTVYSSLANIYDYQDDYEHAIDYHTKALILAKELDLKPNIAIALSNIAGLYRKTKDYDEAIEYYEESLKLKKKVSSDYSIGLGYFNYAQVYDEKKEYSRAIEMLNLSKDYAIKSNDQIGIALCDMSIGNCYLSINDIQNDSSSSSTEELNLLNEKELLLKAYDYQKNAVSILESINDVHYVSNAYNGLGAVLGNLGRYKEAVSYHLKAFEITKGKDLSTNKTASEGLYESYKRNKNFKQALKWHETFLSLSDSINSRKNLKEIGKKQAELSFIKTQEIKDLKHQTELEQISYQNEKKQLIAQNEQRKQRYIIWTIMIGFLSIGFFLILMIRRWRIAKSQKETINQQKLLIEKEKKATEDSINYASSIQNAAFPSDQKIKNIIPKNFILFNPKDIVSGDFYWASQIKNKRFIALADCTGHGVPGAFMTLISLNILNQIIADGIDSPTRILEELHTRLQKRLNNNDGRSSKHGLDIAICMLEEQKLTYAGVHIPVYHIRNGNLTEYKGQKFQLGSNDSTLFQQHEILLQNEDSFYISTDGFPDQKGGVKGKKYFYPTLRKKLTSIVNLDLEEQRKNLNEEFLNWKGELEQLDDVSILGFKI